MIDTELVSVLQLHRAGQVLIPDIRSCPLIAA